MATLKDTIVLGNLSTTGTLNATTIYENGTSLDDKYAAKSHSHSNYVTTDTAQTITGLKTFKGNESNDISFVYYGNSTISGYGKYTAIRHAISFPWYNDIYQIGNIRGDSSDSLGFGITKGNSELVARFVDSSNAYIGNNSIIHSGNIGSQSVDYANSAGSANSVAWGNVTGKPSEFTPASHTHTSLNTAFVFNNSDMPQGSDNLSKTAATHKINFYRNGLSIPYQAEDPNDGGILRCRGSSESSAILELGTWDDSGAGETIQFNYYPTTSQITPTYSVSVPKKTGTIALTNDLNNYLPLSGGTLTGTLGFKSNYLVKPVAEFRTQDNTFTGAITIALPAGISNTMVSMWIDVYNYVTNTSFSVHVGGYTYENNTWQYNPFAMVYGANHTVRLGHNGTNFVIYIGETNSTWNYPQISVRDVILGYAPAYDNWKKDWGISFVTSFSNVSATINNYAWTTKNFTPPASLPANGGNADTVDGKHSSDFYLSGSNITNLPINGGIYWNSYVESSSDGSDAASITVIKDGNGSGGTVLQIKQANDANDIVNVVAGDLKVNGNSVINSGNIGSQSVNYANSAGSANSANSVAWGNVSGKPSSFNPASHTHTSLKSNTDNRNSNTTPNDYNGVLNIAGLKDNSKIGLDTNTYGTYSCLIGVRGWADSSGGDSHEIALTGNGQIMHRSGSTTSWGGWDKIAHTSYIDTYFPRAKYGNDSYYSDVSNSFIGGVAAGPRTSGWEFLYRAEHRNGAGDGPNYVMEMVSDLTSDSSIYWRKKTGAGGPFTSFREIIDSNNIGSQLKTINGNSIVGSGDLAITEGVYKKVATGITSYSLAYGKTYKIKMNNDGYAYCSNISNATFFGTFDISNFSVYRTGKVTGTGPTFTDPKYTYVLNVGGKRNVKNSSDAVSGNSIKANGISITLTADRGTFDVYELN